jgi:hemoglobin-like flavoprotein
MTRVLTGKSIFTQKTGKGNMDTDLKAEKEDQNVEAKSTKSFMSLSDDQIQLVQETWGRFYSQPQMHPLIFKNFFNLSPEILPLFSFSTVQDVLNSPELRNHASKVTSTLDRVIDQLPVFDSDLNAFLKRLGSQHANQFKVRPIHFNAFGAALIKTVKDCQDFSDEARSAWESVYFMV